MATSLWLRRQYLLACRSSTVSDLDYQLCALRLLKEHWLLVVLNTTTVVAKRVSSLAADSVPHLPTSARSALSCPILLTKLCSGEDRSLLSTNPDRTNTQTNILTTTTPTTRLQQDVCLVLPYLISLSLVSTFVWVIIFSLVRSIVS